MSDSLKIGMVGCGGIAGAHREGYQILWEHGLRDFEIIAACCQGRFGDASTWPV